MAQARAWFAQQGLTRPLNGRWLGGVCAGLAARIGVPAVLVRVLFVASVLFPGPQFVVYLALWLLMPSASARTGPTAG
jgi:phage shock protein PspC (stress-responsive transcriptional regulator)